VLHALCLPLPHPGGPLLCSASFIGSPGAGRWQWLAHGRWKATPNPQRHAERSAAHTSHAPLCLLSFLVLPPLCFLSDTKAAPLLGRQRENASRHACGTYSYSMFNLVSLLVLPVLKWFGVCFGLSGPGCVGRRDSTESGGGGNRRLCVCGSARGGEGGGGWTPLCLSLRLARADPIGVWIAGAEVHSR
jgi:hypothetical protein